MPNNRNFFLYLCTCIKLLRIILKTKGVLNIIEYKIPKIIFDSVRLEIKAGKMVLKSSIDLVRAKNAPCHINIIYTFLGIFLFIDVRVGFLKYFILFLLF